MLPSCRAAEGNRSGCTLPSPVPDSAPAFRKAHPFSLSWYFPRSFETFGAMTTRQYP